MNREHVPAEERKQTVLILSYIHNSVCLNFVLQLIVSCYILYPIVQRNQWFANLDVPFQSVTNNLLHGQFAMQMYALHQVDVTSELLHS